MCSLYTSDQQIHKIIFCECVYTKQICHVVPSPPSFPQVVLEVARRIIEDGEENVALICDPDQPSFSASELLDVRDLMGGREGVGHRLEVWPMKVDWCYVRDTAPTFVVSQSAREVRGVAWTFTE